MRSPVASAARATSAAAGVLQDLRATAAALPSAPSFSKLILTAESRSPEGVQDERHSSTLISPPSCGAASRLTVALHTMSDVGSINVPAQHLLVAAVLLVPARSHHHAPRVVWQPQHPT